MTLLWLAAAAAQCLLLLGLWRFARRIILQLDPSPAPAPSSTPSSAQWPASSEGVPLAAMIIPAAGNHPAMPEALRTLLRQDYPRLRPVLVTASADDPAAALGRELQKEFPALELVSAGQAEGCGQKNHNTLAAIAHVDSTGETPQVYLFCDSTHTAQPDFARQLLWPIVAGEAAFTTGYHNVRAGDDQPVTLGYQVSVLLMRFLQAVAVFTQPWGGAMAMTREVFQRHGIAEFWRHNVVDDCSLAGMLMQRRLHVQLCPHAMLSTTARNHQLPVWRAWMDRQVLFLKFCVPGQWWLLGVFAALMSLPTLGSALVLLGGATNTLKFLHMGGPAGAWAVLAAAAHLGALAAVVLGWRELLPRPVPALRWLAGFGLGMGMFALVYVRSVRATGILWHGIWYEVGKGGRVENMRR